MVNNKQVQQDKGNLSIYESVRNVPTEAKKEIEAGRLKGKHDINPMWRIKKLTEVLSPTGTTMALWKSSKPSMKFNSKAFKEADPAGYALYMEPTRGSRRFTVK